MKSMNLASCIENNNLFATAAENQLLVDRIQNYE